MTPKVSGSKMATEKGAASNKVRNRPSASRNATSDALAAVMSTSMPSHTTSPSGKGWGWGATLALDQRSSPAGVRKG